MPRVASDPDYGFRVVFSAVETNINTARHFLSSARELENERDYLEALDRAYNAIIYGRIAQSFLVSLDILEGCGRKSSFKFGSRCSKFLDVVGSLLTEAETVRLRIVGTILGR